MLSESSQQQGSLALTSICATPGGLLAAASFAAVAPSWIDSHSCAFAGCSPAHSGSRSPWVCIGGNAPCVLEQGPSPHPVGASSMLCLGRSPVQDFPRPTWWELGSLQHEPGTPRHCHCHPAHTSRHPLPSM